MDVIHDCVAGLDVHKDTVVACVRTMSGTRAMRECRTYETTTDGLLALLEWLSSSGCSVVAMEATGVYWLPVWKMLSDGGFKLVLANAAHIKAVPGRKTNMNDAMWIADLAAYDQFARIALAHRLDHAPSARSNDVADHGIQANVGLGQRLLDALNVPRLLARQLLAGSHQRGHRRVWIGDAALSEVSNYIEPLVLDEANSPPDGWDDPVKGRIRWRTLFSKGGTPTDGITCGVADLGPGDWLGLHRHAPPEIYYVIAGSGLVTLNGREFGVKAGTAVFIPGMAEHGVRQTGTEFLRFFYGFPVDSFDSVEYLFSAASPA